ncbi:MAG: flagellar hook-associated protein FlgK [Negativicutes bacterium]|nr:flagellar hook-associated protein FlgK [Negativicutes bacterium]
MIGTFTGINTVTLALEAQQAAQDTTGHNISNANTTGYSRQTANLTTMPSLTIYQGGGPVQLGTGVNVASITRARDSFIDNQYRQQNAAKNFWQSQTDELSQVENIFTDTNDDGLQASINAFYTSLQTLGANANDVGARTNVRETANSMVQVIQQDAQHLRDIANDLTNQISTQVSNINNIAQQVAALNKQIVTQESSGSAANDLRDQRDQLLDQLSAITNVQTSEDKSGAVSVSVAGVSLVQNTTVNPLMLKDQHNDTYNFDSSTVTQANGLSGTLTFTGGSLASAFQLRDQTVTGYLDNLNNVAQFLLQDFNNQQQAGQDNNGTTTKAAVVGPPAVAASTVALMFGSLPTGTLPAAANPYSTAAAYTPPNNDWLDQLQVNPLLYTTSGLNYIAASAKGAAGTADGTNALALANVLYNDPSPAPSPANALGNVSLSNYYNTMIGTLGVQSQQASNMNDNQAVLLTSTTNWRESVSGVSTDEEMSNMITFQKAYGAAATVLSTMNSMLNTLIASVGGTV